MAVCRNKPHPFKMELVKRGIKQWEVAVMIGHAPSTVCRALNDRELMTAELRRKIPLALKRIENITGAIKDRKIERGKARRADGNVMTTEEAAFFIGRSAGAVRNLTWRRRIPHRKVAGRLVFYRDELSAWMNQSPGIGLIDL